MKIKLLILLTLLPLFILAQRETLIVPNGMVMTVGAAADTSNAYLYTYAGPNCVMWQKKTQRQLYTFKVNGSISRVKISPDGAKLLIGYENSISVFSTVTGKLIFGESDNSVNDAVFSDDSQQLFWFTNYIIKSINANTGGITSKADITHYFDSSTMFNMSDGDLLFTNSEGWEVWDTKPLALKQKFKFGTTVSHYPVFVKVTGVIAFLKVSPQGSAVHLYSAATGKLIKVIKDAAMSEYTKLIASVDNGQLIAYNPGDIYLLINTQTGSIDRKQKPESELLSPFYGKKQMVMMDGGYKKAADSICLYDYDLSTSAKVNSYKRSLMFTHAVTSIADSNAVNFNGTLTFNLDNLKGNAEKRVSYERPGQASANQTLVVSTNAARSNLYISTALAGVKTLIIPPVNFAFESSLYFISTDGTRVYYAAKSKATSKESFFEYDVNSKTSRAILSISETRVTAVSGSRQQIAFIDVDAGAAKIHLKVYDLRLKKLVYTKEVSDRGDRGRENNFDQLLFADNDASVIAIKRESAEKYDLGQAAVKTFDDKSFLAPLRPNNASISFVSYRGSSLKFYNSNLGLDFSLEIGIGVKDIFFSKDDKYVFALTDDYTTQVWNTSTQKKLGTLYVFGSGDYVFVDETGRFDGTEGSLKQLYFVKNREVIPLYQVYERYYTPQLYQRLLNGEIFNPMPDNDIKPAPRVKITYAQVTRNLNVVDDKTPVYTNATGVAEITVNASAENDKVEEIRLFHNGKIVNLATRGLFVTDNTTGTDTKKYTLKLLPGVNNIRAVALNTQLTESVPDDITVRYAAAGQANVLVPVNTGGNGIVDAVDKNATLHLVVVGINVYKNPKMSLNYALADATAFKDEAERDAHTMITNVKTYFVTDDKADKNGIVAAMTEVQKNAKPQDVFVFYYAGHGVISEKNKEFYLVPNDVTDLKNVDQALAQNGIPSKMLQQYAIDIAAQKQVFILDACQSAGAFATLLTNDANQQKSLAVVARSTGTHWIAASGSQQFANEFSQLGHGAFTYVLLKAMKGEAASNKMVTINGLKNFLQVQVPHLMKKYNGTPQYPASYGVGNDFPVQVMK